MAPAHVPETLVFDVGADTGLEYISLRAELTELTPPPDHVDSGQCAKNDADGAGNPCRHKPIFREHVIDKASCEIVRYWCGGHGSQRAARYPFMARDGYVIVLRKLPNHPRRSKESS